MNTELWFTRTTNREVLLTCIAKRLNAPPDRPGIQPDWGLEASYDSVLAADPKRKIIVSSVVNGWIAAVESQEAIDFALLQAISERLETDVIVCQYYDTAGVYAYARCLKGSIVESRTLEDMPDPLNAVREYLRDLSVPFDLLSFGEALLRRKEGWEILHR